MREQRVDFLHRPHRLNWLNYLEGRNLIISLASVLNEAYTALVEELFTSAQLNCPKHVLVGLLSSGVWRHVFRVQGSTFKLGLVDNPGCGRCKQAIETASHVLCDSEALTTSRFRHLGCHFMKPGDFEDIPVSRILHFVQGAGLLNAWT